VISDLEANFQTALATGQTAHKIRQAISPNETLSTSLARSLYEAAGRPQGSHSFLVLETIHYRIGDEWAEANIHRYRMEMAALSVIRLRRVRKNSTREEAYDSPKKLTSDSQMQGSPSEETEKADSAGP
jgi:hypothetical protein